MIPRSTYIGSPLFCQPIEEQDHYIKCQTCGGWIDCRDLGSVFDHDGEGATHPKMDREQ